MKIQGRYLIVALVAVLIHLTAATSGTAIGQDANTVNLRTTVAPARPGRVAVLVTVDKNRVRVGEPVRVNLTPPAGVSRPRFRVSFGDGKEAVTGFRQINYQYDKVGHYDISAWVPVEPPPLVPSVSLSVAPNPAVVREPVTLKARLAFKYAGIKYRFMFGDKDQTDWQDQPQTTHAYASANTYQAYAEIGEEDNGAIKPLRGSAREPIRVNTPQPVSVDLTADPTTVEVGRRVTFKARAISRDPNISYKFIFGDGSQSDWQTSSQATHEYASPNTYLAYVQIGSSSVTFSRPIISSARKSIRVMAAPPVSVDLTVSPTTVKTETPVTFTARVDSRARNIQYRFFYGDGSSSKWQVRSSATHKYSVADTYFGYVEAGLSNNNQGVKVLDTSKTQQVTVTASPTPTPTPTPTPSPTPTQTPTPTPTPTSTPTPTPTPGTTPAGSPTSSPGGSPSLSPGSSPILPPGGPIDPWTFPWWYLLIVLLIGGGGYWAFMALFVPRPTFRSRADAGSSAVDEGSKSLAINSEILLKPDIADGDYLVSTGEPNLVKSVRRENG